MAGIQWNFAVQGSNASLYSMQDGGAPGTVTDATKGFTVGTKAATNYANRVNFATVAAASFAATPQPSGAPSAAGTSSFIGCDTGGTPILYNKLVQAGTWNFSMVVIAVGATVVGGAITFRVWLSPANDASGSFTEITSGIQTSSLVSSLTTSTGQTITATFNPGNVALVGYIYFDWAWKITSASASSTSGLSFRSSNAGSFLSTPNTYEIDESYPPPPGFVLGGPSNLIFVPANYGDDFAPVAAAPGQPDEDIWANQVPPVPASFWQQLPIGDKDEIPAGALFGVPEEVYWINPVAPIPALPFQPPPIVDRDEIPAGLLLGPLDEDFWLNQVAPIPAALFRVLPFKDPDEIPGGLFGVPEEVYWINPVPPVAATHTLQLPAKDPEELPAGQFYGQADEDFWKNHVAPVAAQLYQRLPVGDLEDLPAGAFFGQPDEDFWRNMVAPVLAAIWQRLPIGDVEEIPGGLFGQADEDFTAPAPMQAPQIFARSSPVNDDLPVTAAATVVDEDARPITPPQPVAAYARAPLFDDDRTAVVLADDGGAPQPAPAFETRYLRLALVSDDDLPAPGLDEEFWQAPIVTLPVVARLQVHGGDDLVFALGVDEAYWISHVQALPASLWQRLPLLADRDDGPFTQLRLELLLADLKPRPIYEAQIAVAPIQDDATAALSAAAPLTIAALDVATNTTDEVDLAVASDLEASISLERIPS